MSDDPPSILNIPLELLDEIIDLIPAIDLAHLSCTCKKLNKSINNERVWRRHCEWELGIHNHSPYESFEECFKKLYRHRWLRPSIWFGDKNPFGTLAISTYNERTGYIEFDEVRPSTAQIEVMGGPFSVLGRMINDEEHGMNRRNGPNDDGSRDTVTPDSVSSSPLSTGESTPRIKNNMAHLISYGEPLVVVNDQTDYDNERTLINFSSSRGLFRCLMRAPALLPERIHPSMSVWPTPNIPCKDRTRNSSATEFRGHLSKAATPSRDLLRIRTWLEYSSGPVGVMMGEAVETYGRLSQDLLIPSVDSPWKGLWIYRGESNGEFLLFHQPTPQRLEAIKLTGNNKVPRGEIAFFIEDLMHPVPETLSFVPSFIIKKHKPVLDARYQTADLNYTNPIFNNGQIVFYESDAILLYDEYGSYVGDCCRVDHDLLIAAKLPHVLYP